MLLRRALQERPRGQSRKLGGEPRAEAMPAATGADTKREKDSEGEQPTT